MATWETELDRTVQELTRAVRLKPAEHFPAGILRRALRLKLVEGVKVFAREPIPLQAPLFVVRQGEPRPDYERLAYAAQRRLREPREQTLYRATQRAANIFGGRSPRINPLQAWHDCQLSYVLEAHRARGGRPDCWVGEDMLGSLAKQFPKIPDAFVLQDPVLIVEFIGDYPAGRIRRLVESYDAIDFDLELW